ncbi:MAG TPA: CDP-alcohol phosphatidyltransferase family protein [Pirellulales bacterium]|jgi:phosphatidylglycerophosphate synthase|nr:CDP-alcohol phosphatidyltransferase family protein [Pirellulales bacterium]
MEYFTYTDNGLYRIWSAAGPAVFVGLYFLIGLMAYGVRCTIYGRFRDAEIDARGSSVLLNNAARTYFAWVMQPVWSFLRSANITPNAVTSVSVLLAAAGGVAVALDRFSLGGWLYLCSGACDFLDGRLARITGKTSASGAALDSILDRYSEAAMLIGLAWYYRETWVLIPVLAFLTGSFLVPYVRARGEGLGLELKVGLMQRPERVVILGLATAFSPLLEIGSSHDQLMVFHWLTVLAIVLLAVSTQFTAAHRLLHVTRALHERSGTSPAYFVRERLPLAAALLATSLALEFALVWLLVTRLDQRLWVATAAGCMLGSTTHYWLKRLWRPEASDTSAGNSVIGVGSVLLNSGSVAVLMLAPAMSPWLAWAIARSAVLAAWNYPMRGSLTTSAASGNTKPPVLGGVETRPTRARGERPSRVRR